MVSSHSSSGVKAARGRSLERRLTQYWQSYTQTLVISTFSREMHRPSAEKEWQQPGAVVLPMVPGRPGRSMPLEVQAASYLAASDRIVNLSISSMSAHLFKRTFVSLYFICGKSQLEIEKMFDSG